MKDFALNYIEKLHEGLKKLDFSSIESIGETLKKAKTEGKQIFIIGNGGSASTASHFACDLGKGTIKNFDSDKRFKVTSLTDNVAVICAYANDLCYEDVFAEQLKNFLKEGDVVIAISASGNSKNIIKAVKVAKENKAKTIGFLGFDGGKLKDLVDISVIFEEKHYGRVEDSHLIIEHLVCEWLKNN